MQCKRFPYYIILLNKYYSIYYYHHLKNDNMYGQGGLQ